MSNRFPASPTRNYDGMEYVMPDGSRVRVMDAQTTRGGAGQRASFENANGQAVGIDGKPVQPPRGLTKPERKAFVRERTHVELY